VRFERIFAPATFPCFAFMKDRQPARERPLLRRDVASAAEWLKTAPQKNKLQTIVGRAARRERSRWAFYLVRRKIRAGRIAGHVEAGARCLR